MAEDHTERYTGQLFHISEQAGIKLFEPRPSPSYYAQITGDAVFAITGKLLHNYLLPRDCPRVTFYAADLTTNADKEKFMGQSLANHLVIVENGWYKRINNTVLTCYEFPTDSFILLDECAGYYVSYKSVAPIGERRIVDILDELMSRNIELRFTPSLIDIASAVSKSTLNFSLIRMRNAKQ